MAVHQAEACTGRTLPAGRSEAAVSRLFVVPAFRRQAIGQRLLARTQEWADARGLDLVLEVVDDRRATAVSLYEATGWQLSHISRANWTGPSGCPVQLRHYRRPRSAARRITTVDGARGDGRC